MSHKNDELNVNVRLDCQNFDSFSNLRGTLENLLKLGVSIMSAISDFAVKQNAFNDKMDAAISNLQGDVQKLNDEITRLQNSPGAVTPEDQASLDALEARGQGISDKLDALDALTPPVPPVA